MSGEILSREWSRTIRTPLEPGARLDITLEATYMWSDSAGHTFRLANGYEVKLPRQQLFVGEQLLWNGKAVEE